MKKLSKKELEIVVEEIVGKIKEIGVERELKEFNESEEGKEILKGIEEVNLLIKECKEKKKELEDLFNESKWGKVKFDDMVLCLNSSMSMGEVNVSERWGYGKNYELSKNIEKEIILGGIKEGFDLDKLIKELVEKFS